MFDFENLTVYKKAKLFHKEVIVFLKSANIDLITRDQLKRASLSIVLNIAEGSGKFSQADKRYFYTTSRGSAYECVAIFDVLKDDKIISEENFLQIYKQLEELSKMLLGLINSQK